MKVLRARGKGVASARGERRAAKAGYVVRPGMKKQSRSFSRLSEISRRNRSAYALRFIFLLAAQQSRFWAPRSSKNAPHPYDRCRTIRMVLV